MSELAVLMIISYVFELLLSMIMPLFAPRSRRTSVMGCNVASVMDLNEKGKRPKIIINCQAYSPMFNDEERS